MVECCSGIGGKMQGVIVGTKRLMKGCNSEKCHAGRICSHFQDHLENACCEAKNDLDACKPCEPVEVK